MLFTTAPLLDPRLGDTIKLSHATKGFAALLASLTCLASALSACQPAAKRATPGSDAAAAAPPSELRETAAPRADGADTAEADREEAAARTPRPEVTAPPRVLNPPPDGPAKPDVPHPRTPADVVAAVQEALRAEDRARLAQLVAPPSPDPGALDEVPLEALTPLLSGRVTGDAHVHGRRAEVPLDGARTVVLLDRDGWRVDLALTRAFAPPQPGPRVPDNRPVSLEEAVAELPGAGDALHATFETDAGAIVCRLFPQRAPRTVANFVGLARGLRAFVDPKTGAWVRRPFYDQLTLYRAVPGALVVGGDPLKTGRGGPGYAIADELSATLRFDGPGVIAMANRGPNTAGSQFFVTLAAAPELDDRSAPFGRCDGPETLAVLRAIAARAVDGHGLLVEPVTIRQVTFERR